MTTVIQGGPSALRRLRLPLLAALAAGARWRWPARPSTSAARPIPAGQVEISNTAGSVVVTHGPQRGRGDRRTRQGRRAPGGLEVRQGHARQGDPAAKSCRVESSELVVKVPAGSSLAVNTVSADIGVRGVRGSQRLQSVSGNIQTEAAAEDVECKTVSGDVNVTGSGQRGLLTVTTVSGDAA